MHKTSNPISRRDAVRLLSTSALALGGATFLTMSTTSSAAINSSTTKAATSPLGFELPALPYAYDALEPHIDAKTVEIHHGKHHAAYITNAKKLLEPHPELIALGAQAIVADLGKVPESIRAGVRNNVGGHVNHTFFWPLLAKPTEYSAGRLQAEIGKTFGSLDAFKTQFGAAAVTRFGSGWAWLSVKRGGGLVIHSTPNQDSPVSEGLQPIIGLDVWEHAYYLKYQNRRADYVTAFWSLLNWNQAEANFSAVNA